jgi:hypothetical protein
LAETNEIFVIRQPPDIKISAKDSLTRIQSIEIDFDPIQPNLFPIPISDETKHFLSMKQTVSKYNDNNYFE